VTKSYNPIIDGSGRVGIRENMTRSVANYVLAMGGVEISRVMRPMAASGTLCSGGP